MERAVADDPEIEVLLVTGADHTHGRTLRQLLASVRRHEPAMRVIVYDLGMTAFQRWRIRMRQPHLELKRFAFEKYPQHLDIRIRAGEYAWKPVIVWSLLEAAAEPVCWMDAGNVLTEPLTALQAALRRSGFYSPHSAGTIADWTHPKMLEYFGVDQAWAQDKRNLNGACVAFDPASHAARALAKRWQEGALHKACIAPEGSSRSNHRQDQALLTVLAHLAGMAQRSVTERLGFLIQQDVARRPPATLRKIRRILFPGGTPSVVKRALHFFD